MASIESALNPVIAAVDLQPLSRQVLLRARSMAAERRLPLLVLHVAHETSETAGFYRSHTGRNIATPIRDVAERMLNELVDDVLGSTGDDSEADNIHTLVVEGIPGSRILEVAGRKGAECIVMNCCGLQGIARWLCGSVSAYVQKHADCDVVMLNENAEEAPMCASEQPVTSLHAAH